MAEGFRTGAALSGKRALPKIIPAMFDVLLARAESEFVAAQTVVGRGSPAQMETGDSIRGITFNRLPHYQIIGAQVLERMIGGPELEYGAVALVEINRGGHRSIPNPRGHDEPMAGSEHMPGDVLEEFECLGRQSVPPPRQAVQ